MRYFHFIIPPCLKLFAFKIRHCHHRVLITLLGSSEFIRSHDLKTSDIHWKDHKFTRYCPLILALAPYGSQSHIIIFSDLLVFGVSYRVINTLLKYGITVLNKNLSLSAGYAIGSIIGIEVKSAVLRIRKLTALCDRKGDCPASPYAERI